MRPVDTSTQSACISDVERVEHKMAGDGGVDGVRRISVELHANLKADGAAPFGWLHGQSYLGSQKGGLSSDVTRWA